MTKVFTFHADAAHGWLEVSTSDLAQLGFIPASFSKYSYADRKGALPVYYLEEDADASKFVLAWEAKHKAKIQTKEKYQHTSFIRHLGRISS